MTEVDYIIMKDHSFLPPNPPVEYIFGEFSYIDNDSLKEMLKCLYLNISQLNIWEKMKEGNFKIVLIQKQVKKNIELCDFFCLEMYPYAIHIMHHIALHGEEDFRSKYTLKKLKKLF